MCARVHKVGHLGYGTREHGCSLVSSRAERSSPLHDENANVNATVGAMRLILYNERSLVALIVRIILLVVPSS